MNGLESIMSSFAQAGLRVDVRLEAFHARRIVLGHPTGETRSFWLDRGLHFWRRPRMNVAAEHASLAARRTMEQHIFIQVLGAQGSPATPGPVPPTAEAGLQPARLRRLLAEIGRLKDLQATGKQLRPAQSAKIGREGSYVPSWRTRAGRRAVLRHAPGSVPMSCASS